MSELPQGTVTLFFADVEGSTRHARDYDGAWGDVLADVRRLLREAVVASGGHEVDTRGDELFAAFASAPAAADAALAAQRAHAEHAWAGEPVRVRIGLHTGSPLVTEDGYVGIDVHRASRISGAGHGGQVLLSARTRADLDDAHEVRDLGIYALPDIPDVERIFQLGAGEARRALDVGEEERDGPVWQVGHPERVYGAL